MKVSSSIWNKVICRCFYYFDYSPTISFPISDQTGDEANDEDPYEEMDAIQQKLLLLKEKERIDPRE